MNEMPIDTTSRRPEPDAADTAATEPHAGARHPRRPEWKCVRCGARKRLRGAQHG